MKVQTAHHTAKQNETKSAAIRSAVPEFCRSCRSAVIHVASDRVASPFKYRFCPTRLSRQPFDAIMLYFPTGLVRAGGAVQIVLRLQLHMPDLTLSLVTNELSHLDGAANQGPQIV